MSDVVLVVGCGGQLAQAIILAAADKVECVGLNRAQLDITDPDAIVRTMDQLRPSLVINGSGYNFVDLAESDGLTSAFQINTLAVGYLARECRKREIPLLHFSTDLVFDGLKHSPYSEGDRTSPLSVYGASKLAGENLVLCMSAQNVVVRVCRLFGPSANPEQGSARKPSGNFPMLMLRLARERRHIRVVDDQIGAPTYTPDLARAVWQLLASGQKGLFQLSNAGEVSFAEYASEIFRLTSTQCVVEKIATHEYGAAAPRPLYSVLDNSKAHHIGVIPLRHWSEALDEYLTRLPAA